MKYIFLLLSVLMFTVYSAQAQETKKITKEKKVIIIEKDKTGKTVRKEIISTGNDSDIEIEDREIDSLVQSLLQEINIEEGSDKSKKKRIIIRTDGTMEEEIVVDQMEMMKDVQLEIDDETGEKRIVMKIVKNGQEEIMEWHGSADEEIPAEFSVEVDESYVDIEKLPIPAVSMGIAVTEEVEIEEVMTASAAEEAGLQKGDKILKIDNQIIYSHRGLLEHLCSYRAGDKVKVTILRSNRTKKIKLKLRAR